jgi:opacity protein-like surface antigen
MAQRIGFMFVGLMLVATAASAQPRLEASFSFGYTGSEGINSDERAILGAVYDTIGVDGGSSLNFTFGVFVSPQAELEFLFARQGSRLTAEGPVATQPISEMSLYNYMFNFVYNVGEPEARVRPYFFGGLGATQYSFGNLLVTPPAGLSGGQIDSSTRFSSNWGGGVKLYFSPNVGAKVGVRWIPTYIKSDPAGVWCDPWYGCWQLVDNKYSNQFETSGGVTFRFDD